MNRPTFTTELSRYYHFNNKKSETNSSVHEIIEDLIKVVILN